MKKEEERWQVERGRERYLYVLRREGGKPGGGDKPFKAGRQHCRK